MTEQKYLMSEKETVKALYAIPENEWEMSRYDNSINASIYQQDAPKPTPYLDKPHLYATLEQTTKHPLRGKIKTLLNKFIEISRNRKPETNYSFSLGIMYPNEYKKITGFDISPQSSHFSYADKLYDRCKEISLQAEKLKEEKKQKETVNLTRILVSELNTTTTSQEKRSKKE